MEVMASAQPLSELILPAPPLPGMAVTLEAGNEGAGCFINALESRERSSAPCLTQLLWLPAYC